MSNCNVLKADCSVLFMIFMIWLAWLAAAELPPLASHDSWSCPTSSDWAVTHRELSPLIAAQIHANPVLCSSLKGHRSCLQGAQSFHTQQRCGHWYGDCQELGIIKHHYNTSTKLTFESSTSNFQTSALQSLKLISKTAMLFGCQSPHLT